MNGVGRGGQCEAMGFRAGGASVQGNKTSGHSYPTEAQVTHTAIHHFTRLRLHRCRCPR